MAVELEQSFWQQGESCGFWQSNSRILLAISGGVDSMVLLSLMEKVAAKRAITLAVAHVNHQLREESAAEEAFLRNYCAQAGIAFYSRRWEEPATTGLEEAARKFRYHFFREVMTEQGYDRLMTAHHSDDQLETMLMKMVRAGNLQTAGGIKAQQNFAKGRLVRPLLTFAKEELVAYAQQHQLVYFEDVTNTLLDVQRNRLRHQVVPLLKAENPQVLAHFNQLAQQIQWTTQWQQESLQTWFEENVTSFASGWTIPVQAFLTLPQGQRYFSVQYCLLQLRNQYQVPFNEEQLQGILHCLASARPQWTVELSGGWQARGEYEKFFLQKKRVKIDVASQVSQKLTCGNGIFLSDREWLGILPATHAGILPEALGKIPEKVKLWSEFSHALSVDFPTEVMLRKRIAGDRIQLTPALRKKVSRILIDEKIPNEMRERAWVMTNHAGSILGVLPVALSYLSIAKETDKIHYRLLYKYKNNDE